MSSYSGNVFQDLNEELLPESTIYWFIISLCAAIIWVIYLTYYNSRVLGLIVTVILNKIMKHGHIKFGSFSISVLSGKIMFRDVHLITGDYSIRILLGFAIFRWWQPITAKSIKKDSSHLETRLSIYLDSFEIHVYNRSSVYRHLEKVFGLQTGQPDEPPDEEVHKPIATLKRIGQWRDLVPVVSIKVFSGRFVFGNYLIPQMLSIIFGNAHFVYTTKPASTPFDQFMHVTKCTADSVRAVITPSPKFLGKVVEPPRCTGDGFVVLQSSDVDIYYYLDEPGLVPHESKKLQLADGGLFAVRTWPCWGMDVKCGRDTNISYGPWADKQRDLLWHFFFPPDYLPVLVSVPPKPGQPRICRSFDFKMDIQNTASVDLVFTKNEEIHAFHMNCGEGSYLEFSVPFVLDEPGYVIRVSGQLMNVDISTSLTFRSLLECETLEYLVKIEYPEVWNDHQNWNMELMACKASGHLIIQHKTFFVDLMDDWSSEARPDIFHFTPYTWHVSILLREFELLTLTNEWNWIDCSSATPENAHLAVCGNVFELSFDLPFVNYLPKTVPVKFFISGETLEAQMYLPETNTSRHIVTALSENVKILERDGMTVLPSIALTEKWSRICQKSEGWVVVWITPKATVNIGYTYHPIPPTGDENGYEVDESLYAEEMLLIPERLVPHRPLRPKKSFSGVDSAGGGWIYDFNPATMASDQVTVEFEVDQTVCFVYGSLVQNFLHFKQNYFGENIKFTDFEQKTFSSNRRKSGSDQMVTNVSETKEKPFDPRRYRPLHTKFVLVLHDVQAHLVKNCTENGPPCPCLCVERLVFEIDKRYEETKLQLFVSPVLLVSKDLTQRPASHEHLESGHLSLSGLQIRGHAMFSHAALPLDSETLEYAWLVELTAGDLTSRLTAPQLQDIIEFLQTFMYLVLDPENKLLRPVPDRLCQHMVHQSECELNSKALVPCPTSDDLKYRIIRLSIDCVDLHVVESGSSLNLQVFPVRFSMCNLHSHSAQLGVTLLVPEVYVKLFVLSVPVAKAYDPATLPWLESGGISFGVIVVDAAVATTSPPDLLLSQKNFLELHDNRTRRLEFLWSQKMHKKSKACGCVGGCQFFGNNRNGPSFFSPSDQDFVNSTNACVLNVCFDGSYYGYGQSLLQSNRLVFDLKALLAAYSKNVGGVPMRRLHVEDISRGSKTSTQKSVRYQSGANLSTSISPSTVSTLIQWEQNKQTVSDANEDTAPSLDYRLSSVAEQDVETINIRSKTLNEDTQGTAQALTLGMDGFVGNASTSGKGFASSEGTSSSSLAEGMQKCQKSLFPLRLGHERKRSYDPPRTFWTMSDNTDRTLTHGSHRSLDSTGALAVADEGVLLQQSNLTSPARHRLSAQNDSSSTSIGNSEKFLSAEEGSSSAASVLSIAKAKMLKALSGAHPIMALAPRLYFDCRSSDSDAKSSSVASFYDVATEFQPADSTTDVDSFVSARSSHNLTSDTVSKAPMSTEDDTTCLARDNEGLETDAVNFVDLRGQINQPITKSPLLRSCYVNHLSQLHCPGWSVPVCPDSGIAISPGISNPDSSRNSCSVSQIHVGIPEFSYLREGFTMKLMTSRQPPGSPMTTSHGSSTPEATTKPDQEIKINSTADTPYKSDTSSESKMTVVVNLKDSVDIIISPLVLEALQRYLEAMTPVLASLSPSTIIDKLHFKCTDYIELQSGQKKHCNTSGDSARKSDRSPDKKKEKSIWRHHQPSRAVTKSDANTGKSTDFGKTEKQTKESQIQVFCTLSKINFCVLQASLVEETISIAALERATELTCVSLLAVCFDNIRLQLLTNSMLHSPPPVVSVTNGNQSGQKRKSSSAKANTRKQVVAQESEIALESHFEDVIGSLNVARVHFQLRRLKKHSNFSESVRLTAIPELHSKVLFTFQRQETPEESQLSSGTGSSRAEAFSAPGNSVEDVAGFIMFECGMESVTLKIALRKGYNARMSEERVKNAAKILLAFEKEAKKMGTHFGEETSTQATFLPTSCIPESCVLKADASKHDSNISAPSLNCFASSNAAGDEKKSGQSTTFVEQNNGATENIKILHDDASSCVLELRTVWFNFATPLPSPRERKLEYTRNDWNLWSTANPAINSWLNPYHRLNVVVDCLQNLYDQRVCAVMACLMTDALELPEIHLPFKSKYSRIMQQSKMLQEDHSCRLLTGLRRYICKVGIRMVEDSQRPDILPQLWMLKKGILVLTRQWKSALYTPHLANANSKMKKKMAVTFAVPFNTSVDTLQSIERSDNRIVVLDNCKVIDEKTLLLRTENSSQQKTESIENSSLSLPVAESSSIATTDVPFVSFGQDPQQTTDTRTDSNSGPPVPVDSVTSTENTRKLEGSRLQAYTSVSNTPINLAIGQSPVLQTDGGSSDILPGVTAGSTTLQPAVEATEVTHNSTTNAIDRTLNSASNGSEHGLPTSVPSTPLRRSLAHHPTGREKCERSEECPCADQLPFLHYYPSVGRGLWWTNTTGMRDFSGNDSVSGSRLAAMSEPALADSQVLFKALLRAMDLQLEMDCMSGLIKKFGGNISITGILNALSIEIVDSESNTGRKANSANHGKPKQDPKFHDDRHSEKSAFLCNTFVMMLSMKNVVDFEKEKENDEAKDAASEKPKNVQQKAWHALKRASDQMEVKPVTTKMNFSVSARSVTQHVDMSLLRLVHQFMTMTENFLKVQHELTDDSTKSYLYRVTHRKSPAVATPSDEYSNKMTGSGYDSIKDSSGSRRKLRETPSDPRATVSQMENIHHASHRPDRLPSVTSVQSEQTPEKSGTGLPVAETVADIPDRTVPFPSHLRNLSGSVAIDMADTSSLSDAEKTIANEVKADVPRCWKTLYHLLNLYSMMPVAKPCFGDVEEKTDEVSGKHFFPEVVTSKVDVRLADRQPHLLATSRRQSTPKSHKSTDIPTPGFIVNENTRLVIFGIAKVYLIHITAHLGGLKLESELQGCQASVTHREKIKGYLGNNDGMESRRKSSVTMSFGRLAIILREGNPTGMQTMATVDVGKSVGLYSLTRHNSSLLTFGVVNIYIPLHPVALHEKVVYSIRQLSTTLQEFIKLPSNIIKPSGKPQLQQTFGRLHAGRNISTAGTLFANSQPMQPVQSKPRPKMIQFMAQLKGLIISASLLPSLETQYKIGEITSSGITGAEVSFTIDFPTHSVSFSSKLNKLSDQPSSASIDLPPIHIYAKYCQHDSQSEPEMFDESLANGLALLEGSYLKAIADVGVFERILDADLLNHLVLVQKVFVMELNEMVQKVSGVDQPGPLWGEDFLSSQAKSSKPLLYSFLFKFKGLQITATTPTMNAVRLESSVLKLELSNRIQRAGRCRSTGESENPRTERIAENRLLKVSVRAQVSLSLTLGTIVKNPVFEEAEPEFQHSASFQTRIVVRNALPDEILGMSKDQKAFIIVMKRPIIFALPAAFDKALLVWLNYKNTYEYWNEQRMALDMEVQTTTQKILTKPPPKNPTKMAAPAAGTLFLQLTVDDLGVCLPLNPLTQSSTGPHKIIEERGNALVLTLDSTQISAYSCGSLASKGMFTGFCLRFADDFQVSLDDWKPEKTQDFVMNSLVIPRGTYEVCSLMQNAIRQHKPDSNAKWILNIQWHMSGVDIHLDTNIGTRLSAVCISLKALIGGQLDDDNVRMACQIPSVEVKPALRKQNESLPDFVCNSNLDSRTRVQLIEKEMNEQAKLVQDLHRMRASENAIEKEERRLRELQTALFHDFRQAIVKKLKLKSAKALTVKDRLSLGMRPQHVRSRSVDITAMGGLKQKGGKFPPMQFTSHGTGKSGRYGGGHSRAFSVDAVKLPSAAGTEVFDRGLSHASCRLNSVASVDLEEDSSPNIPNISNISPSSKEHTMVQPCGFSNSSFDLEIGEQDIIYPRRAIAKMDISVAATPLCSTAEENIVLETPNLGSGGAAPVSSTGAKAPIESTVDFELDIKVTIESGKCMLHPKLDPKQEPGADTQRSFATKGHPQVVPKIAEQKRSSAKKSVTDYATTSSGRMVHTYLQPNITVFFLPGVDIKVHYEMSHLSSELGSGAKTQAHYGSKTGPVFCQLTPGSADDDGVRTDTIHPTMENENATNGGQSTSTAAGFGKSRSLKKAKLYACVSLQQLPEEMLISPTLLDFLEQAIEPIPKFQLVLLKHHKNAKGERNTNPDTLTASFASNANDGSSSFSVDVIIHIQVQPSLVRFTCFPVSRVECLLRIPSLNVVFSTKTTDSEAELSSDAARESKTKVAPNAENTGTPTLLAPNVSQCHISSAGQFASSASGGFSVTACVNDFSLYIFHPYRRGQILTTLSAPEKSLDAGIRKISDASLDDKGNPVPETNRKDSLSLTVKFVRVNILRSSRRLLESDPAAYDAANLTFDPSDQKPAVASSVRLSVVCDVGSASFKYDMRRLLEILALPKAWYRRSLIRRMLLGEEAQVPDSDIESDMEAYQNFSSSSESSLFTAVNQAMSGRSASVRQSDKKPTEASEKPVSSDEKPKDPYLPASSTPSGDTQSPFQEPVYPQSTTAGLLQSGVTKFVTRWETLILFAVNLSKLGVAVNMGNVMGNTTWSAKYLNSRGRLSLGSTGCRNMNVSAELGQSMLEAHGGVIGGLVEIEGLSAEVHVVEDRGQEPEHVVMSRLHIMEMRLDYMGSSILIGRISDLAVKVSDEWQCHQDTNLRPPHTNRSVVIFVHGELKWDRFHLMISRSTTPDLIRIVLRLDEFITQQQTSGRRILSAFGPTSTASKTTVKQNDAYSWISDIRHHRHWQKVLGHLGGSKLSTFPCTLSDRDSVIGGTMSLQGKNISLACFHGINFRSKSWALFTMDEPYISFATEAVDVEDTSVRSTHIVQNLLFQLGHNTTEMMKKQQKATICKLSRGHYVPQPFTSVHEWFNYAFATAEHKDLTQFPAMMRYADGASGVRLTTIQPIVHNTEIIFILPSLQMHLKTEHLQGENAPQDEDPKPTVECSFVTEFQDHIFVTMDAEPILFIHDLISNYVKEKERGSERVVVENPTSVLKQDFRNFECKTWHLEPTVRLLSWAGKQIDPVGVDYILQKLGFQHARLTIPKWLQRGCMDPLDKILSVLVDELFVALREQKQEDRPPEK